MDIDGCVASMGFPSFPRFCGQIFKEAKDKDLALLCVQAYNDFMIDEWCAAAPGRLVPLGIMPLWDVDLAVAEMDRTIAKGMRGFTFSEVPARLGLPSIHDASRHWDPMLAAAADAGTPLCLHIGSSSQVIVTSSDAPDSVMVALFPLNAMIGVTDWIFSGVFDRHPKLQIALSEGGIGWIPFMLERADYTWHHQRWDRSIPRPPSTYFHDHIYGCFIDDAHGAKNIDDIGVDNCMMEVDYPHSDSTWPNTIEIASKHLSTLTPEQKLKVSRTNAEHLFRFQPTGIGQR